MSWATTTRSLRKLKARIIKVGGKREQPQEQAWRLEDTAQWELLFRGEEVFWKVAGAIRKAGYDSIFSLTQDPTKGGSSAPLLTREGGPGSRGTKHLRLLIPKGIAGVTENERRSVLHSPGRMQWGRAAAGMKAVGPTSDSKCDSVKG